MQFYLNRIALGLLVAALLSGCGFQLRGAPEWPETMNPVWIHGLDSRDALYIHLVQNLRGTGVEVLDEPADGVGELRILAVRETRRVLTVTGAAQIGEYALQRRLEAEIRWPGQVEWVSLGPYQVERVYVFDTATALDQGEREADLRLGMNRDLVAFLQRRVQAVVVTNSLSSVED